MKQKLSGRDYTYVASMLFGMFFGAGNLIFPVHMGQMAGSNIWPAITRDYWFLCNRRRIAAARRSGARHQPLRRAL